MSDIIESPKFMNCLYCQTLVPYFSGKMYCDTCVMVLKKGGPDQLKKRSMVSEFNGNCRMHQGCLDLLFQHYVYDNSKDADDSSDVYVFSIDLPLIFLIPCDECRSRVQGYFEGRILSSLIFSYDDVFEFRFKRNTDDVECSCCDGIGIFIHRKPT